jgi:hypothetical protein
MHRKWEEVRECLKESEENFHNNPIPNLKMQIADSSTSILNCFIGMKQIELVKEIIRQGADVHKEDCSSYGLTNANPFIPIFGRRPLHIAVLSGEKKDDGLIARKRGGSFCRANIYYGQILQSF